MNIAVGNICKNHKTGSLPEFSTGFNCSKSWHINPLKRAGIYKGKKCKNYKLTLQVALIDKIKLS